MICIKIVQVQSPKFNADGACQESSGWVCEHRWHEIRHMVKFRSITAGYLVEDIVTDEHMIAFRRGDKGFFMLNNNRSGTWSNTFNTGLKSGTYCDIISGEITPDGMNCTGLSVTVDNDRKAYISLQVCTVYF